MLYNGDGKQMPNNSSVFKYHLLRRDRDNNLWPVACHTYLWREPYCGSFLGLKE